MFQTLIEQLLQILVKKVVSNQTQLFQDSTQMGFKQLNHQYKKQRIMIQVQNEHHDYILAQRFWLSVFWSQRRTKRY